MSRHFTLLQTVLQQGGPEARSPVSQKSRDQRDQNHLGGLLSIRMVVRPAIIGVNDERTSGDAIISHTKFPATVMKLPFLTAQLRVAGSCPTASSQYQPGGRMCVFHTLTCLHRTDSGPVPRHIACNIHCLFHAGLIHPASPSPVSLPFVFSL